MVSGKQSKCKATNITYVSGIEDVLKHKMKSQIFSTHVKSCGAATFGGEAVAVVGVQVGEA